MKSPAEKSQFAHHSGVQPPASHRQQSRTTHHKLCSIDGKMPSEHNSRWHIRRQVSFECATRHPYLCSLLNKVIPRRPPYSTSVRHRIRSVSKHHPYLCIQQRLLTTSLFFASTFSVTKVPPAGVLTEMSSNYQSPSVVVLSIDTLGVSIDRVVTKLPAVGCLDDILILAEFDFAPNA